MDFPASSATVEVSIIDSTFHGKVPTSPFMAPDIHRFETWTPVSYSFLVTHTDKSGTRKILFDLGSPTDMTQDFPPKIANNIQDLVSTFPGCEMTAEKHVSEILEENGVQLAEIEAIIPSHDHCDHIGRPSLFPTTAKIILGPGLKESCYPGYPENPESGVFAREFLGREVIGLQPEEFNVRIGDFQGHDFFGDGSFYLLSAPGHAIGHLNALARTQENNFILFAGDSAHHASQLRPHPGAPIPDRYRSLLKIHPSSNDSQLKKQYHCTHRRPREVHNVTPFQTVSVQDDGWCLAADLVAARQTLEAVQKIDAQPNVFVVLAHDRSLLDVVDLFPKSATDWRKRGWKEQGQWAFLADFADSVQKVIQEHADD